VIPASDRWVVLGKISGIYGIKGWVKVFSETDPPGNILGYAPWRLQQGASLREVAVAEGRVHGKGVVARLEGCSDRDQAALLVGAEISIPRHCLPAAADGEYYWTDLEGLAVRNQQGIEFGRVDHLFETGANDVLVVRGERERMLPFIDQVIRQIDLEQGIITVDWDADF
jgi:16S rRNA processing protein RimM